MKQQLCTYLFLNVFRKTNDIPRWSISSPVRRENITWTNADLLAIWSFGTNSNKKNMMVWINENAFKIFVSKWRSYRPGEMI